LTIPNVGGNRTFAFINQAQTFSAIQTFGQINVANIFNGGGFSLRSGGFTERIRIGGGTGEIFIFGLPTSSAGLASGRIWNDGGTLKIV